MSAELAACRKALDTIEGKFYASENFQVELGEAQFLKIRILLSIAESLEAIAKNT